MKKTIGIIGFGNMGSAIAEQIKKDYPVNCFDKDGAKLVNLSGIKVFSNTADLIKNSDCIILAVKPQDFKELFSQIKAFVSLDKLIISIAAGITTSFIEQAIGMARVVRAMPNLAAKVGAGMTCICTGKFATEEDLDFSEELFDYLGETLGVNEELLDAVTAVSGSGPAYIANFLKENSLSAGDITEGKKKEFLGSFQEAALGAGFDPDSARLLTEVTFSGTLEFLKRTKISPAELIKQVTSKGGTTEAAFKILNQGGSLKEAVLAAKERSQELSKEVNK
ncbi:MAG: pyrroline-5-carboxylate reductase [Candidatus Omnitrophica bacterium]|nr:pyrroline-5-carboxylate reductase [Candidatus Omnitrophota bacterium]